MQSHCFLWFMLSAGLLLPTATWAADQSSEQFKVVKVESWDTLNMRSGPGVKSEVIFRLPHHAQGITMAGGQQTVGRTQWVKISWQGKTGWVSKTYLAVQTPTVAADQATRSTDTVTDTVQLIEPDKSGQTSAKKVAKLAPSSQPIKKDIVKKKQSGMWILECGNTSPFWRVEVLPDWISGRLGEHKTGMPITHKRQEHGKYHKVALETEVRSANRWNKLRMTLRYTRSCYSRLAKKKVSFSVEGVFNDKKISGCCQAMQVP